MPSDIPQADLSLLLAVFLPPAALDTFGPLVAERTLDTPFGPVGPVGLRARSHGPAIWVQPYSGSPVRTDRAPPSTPRCNWALAKSSLGMRV